ncbi:MAG: secretion protein HlyD [Candidatus Berkiellales bacterium]
MRKFSFLALIGILAVIAGVIYYFVSQNFTPKNKLVLHGNVDIRQVDLAFRVSGKLDKVNFDEGDLIKKGAVVAELDKVPFQHEVDNLKAQVAVATANSTKYQTGNRPQEILAAKALVDERKATYENAKKNRARQEELVKRKLASQQAYDDALTQEKDIKEQLENAKELYKLEEEGFRSEDIAGAKSQLEAAKAQLGTAETNLEDTILYAPSDGIVLTRIREPGSILAVGVPVITLSLINPIWVRAYVSEIDLGRIKPGMHVLVYTDTQPNNPYPGEIGFISPQAEFTPKNIETKELRTDLVYRLRIVVEDPKGQLRQGMPVTVVINTEY